MKAGKIILITTIVLIVGAGTAYALSNKKKQPAKKKTGSVVVGDIQVTDESGSTTISPGSSGRYVEQLQQALNDIHSAIMYINANCNISWALFTGWPSTNGNILPVNGVYDAQTAAVSNFYLNRTNVDIDYLQSIQDKISQYKTGDRCTYPLAY